MYKTFLTKPRVRLSVMYYSSPPIHGVQSCGNGLNPKTRLKYFWSRIQNAAWFCLSLRIFWILVLTSQLNRLPKLYISHMQLSLYSKNLTKILWDSRHDSLVKMAILVNSSLYSSPTKITGEKNSNFSVLSSCSWSNAPRPVTMAVVTPRLDKR